MSDEEYEKEMMKYKKVELITMMRKIRDKTKVLRDVYDEYQGTVTFLNNSYKWHEMRVLWEAIKTYLGEK